MSPCAVLESGIRINTEVCDGRGVRQVFLDRKIAVEPSCPSAEMGVMLK